MSVGRLTQQRVDHQGIATTLPNNRKRNAPYAERRVATITTNVADVAHMVLDDGSGITKPPRVSGLS